MPRLLHYNSVKKAIVSRFQGLFSCAILNKEINSYKKFIFTTAWVTMSEVFFNVKNLHVVLPLSAEENIDSIFSDFNDQRLIWAGGGEGGGYSIYPGVGRCGAAPHTLTLFKTNIADFATLFKTELRLLIPCLRHLTRNQDNND